MLVSDEECWRRRFLLCRIEALGIVTVAAAATAATVADDRCAMVSGFIYLCLGCGGSEKLKINPLLAEIWLGL